MSDMKIAFSASAKPDAAEAMARLVALYGNAEPEEADVIAPVGGDGFMLETLKAHMDTGKPIYGINRGTVGFLMNDFAEDHLPERIREAECAEIRPLKMEAVTASGEIHTAIAINEVSLLRETRQSARIGIRINGRMRLDMLICDGVLLATPAGSTAYNLSANGPILPIGSELLALTPISAFRPRRWRGALLPQDAKIEFVVHDPKLRPVSAVADNYEVRDVAEVAVTVSKSREVTLLYDKGHSLEERIIREQFAY